MLTFKIFIRSIKQTLRSPAQLSLIFAFPMAFVLVFAFLFGGSGNGSPSVLTIGFINNDDGELINTWKTEFDNYTKPWSSNDTIDPLTHGFGRFFIDSLKHKTGLELNNKTYNIREFSDETTAIKALRSQALSLVVSIPYDFSYGILSGINSRSMIVNGSLIVNTSVLLNTNVSLTFIGDTGYQSFQKGITELQDALKIFTSHFYGVDLPAGDFKVVVDNVASYELGQFDYFMAGFFTFGLVLSASNVAGILGKEREKNTLDRLKLSEMRPIEFLGGITLTQIVTTGNQLLVMFFATYLFGFKGRGDPVFAFFVTLLTILPVLGIGFFVAAIIPNGKEAASVISILSAPFGFLSGSFIPVPEIALIPNFVPTGTGSLRALQLWDFFPFYSSTTAVREILLFNYTLEQELFNLVFLVIGGLIFFTFGLFFFVKRVFKAE
ncbi:MAG: ABC transporter permease [Candidatus Hodarchaeales archaeon]